MENRTEIKVDFRVNVTRIDAGFADNASRVREIITRLRALANDSTVSITSVSFCGAASPEGSYSWNRYLANARLSSLEKLVRSEVNIPDSIISRNDSYIPWEYLREQVLLSDLPYRDTVLSIIDDVPVLVRDIDSGKPVDRRIVRLKKLNNRSVWRELFNLYFRKMRNASAVIITYKDDRHEIISLPPTPPRMPGLKQSAGVVQPALKPGIITPAVLPVKTESPFYMDIRSNLLTDVLAVPNIGIEFYIGKNWSIAANYIHAWWNSDRRRRYWRIYGAEINARYWFGARPLKRAIQKYLEDPLAEQILAGKSLVGSTIKVDYAEGADNVTLTIA